jgi:hypothetical protein
LGILPRNLVRETAQTRKTDSQKYVNTLRWCDEQIEEPNLSGLYVV